MGYFDFDSTTKAGLISQNGVGKNENETQIKILINYSVMPAARWPWKKSPAIIPDIKPHQNPRSNKSREIILVRIKEGQTYENILMTLKY